MILMYIAFALLDLALFMYCFVAFKWFKDNYLIFSKRKTMIAYAIKNNKGEYLYDIFDPYNELSYSRIIIGASLWESKNVVDDVIKELKLKDCSVVKIKIFEIKGK